MTTTDVGALLDEAHWSGYQKLLVAATALTIVLDGLDNQLLGAAVPALMKEWGLERPAFASVLAAGLIEGAALRLLGETVVVGARGSATPHPLHKAHIRQAIYA